MNGRDLDLCEGPLMTRNGMRPPTPRSSSMTLGGAPSDRKSNTSELQSQSNLVCRLLLEKKKKIIASMRTCSMKSRKLESTISYLLAKSFERPIHKIRNLLEHATDSLSLHMLRLMPEA